MAKIERFIGNLENGKTYYGKVFTANPKGRTNNRVDLPFFTVIPSTFPAEPASYALIDTYTTEQTWIAPEDGWFKIEVHGASGNGGTDGTNGQWTSTTEVDGETVRFTVVKTGGSGGGGAYACSIVKLNEGDTVVLSSFAVGSVATVQIDSSQEQYAEILVKSGGNGGDGSTTSHGTAGSGGTARGGNEENVPGNDGSRGVRADGFDYDAEEEDIDLADVEPLAGGTPGHVDGNYGGQSEGFTDGKQTAYAGAGKRAFVKISRGNTNIA